MIYSTKAELSKTEYIALNKYANTSGAPAISSTFLVPPPIILARNYGWCSAWARSVEVQIDGWYRCACC